MVSTVSLLGARHLGEVVENKPASLLVSFMGKALNRTPRPLCGRQTGQAWRGMGSARRLSLRFAA